MKKNQQPSPAYHHGDLREALLQSAEAVLRRDGLSALTLRACAREAGVSHAAPAHHFPSLADLLSELAAVGFDRLAAAMRRAMSKQDATAMAAGIAYVRFAKDNPGLFFLMSDPSRLDSNNLVLQSARRNAIMVLTEVAPIATGSPTLAQVGAITRSFALVHGFSMLMLTGRLGPLLRLAPDATSEMDLLKAALESGRRN